MFSTLAAFQLTVFWCLALFPIDDFNPHILNADTAYVARHPGICRIEEPVETNACETSSSFALLWQGTDGGIVIGSRCAYVPLELHALW